MRPHCGCVGSLAVCSSVRPHFVGRLWPVHELVHASLLWKPCEVCHVLSLYDLAGVVVCGLRM